MCLALLYLVYAIFFRKETYFRFNRLYLLSIIFLSLLVPSIHVTLSINNSERFGNTIQSIGKLRSYYGHIIALSDPENPSPYLSYNPAKFEEEFSMENNTVKFEGKASDNSILQSTSSAVKDINYAKWFFRIYLLGVLFFLFRLIFLVHHLRLLIKRNKRERHQNYTLILMNEKIPPFSFFRYIFVNKNDLRLKEFEQILTHEKVHVMQGHSLDLFLAHFLTVFQWFNPMVWQLQKAIKTTHEYIADSTVVSQGYELFDYQSLLLSQLVSIQSVELVNNFNLLFIKKRIKMMTKNKSGLPAKLKAATVIPAALAIFLLFANLTLKSPIFSFTNFSEEKQSNFNGLWINNSDDNYGKLLLFDDNSLSVLESKASVNVLKRVITIDNKSIIVHSSPTNKVELKYTLKNDELTIWWSNKQWATYKKSNVNNSFEALKPSYPPSIQLPKAKYSKVLDMQKYILNIYVSHNGYMVGDSKCTLKELDKVLKEHKSTFNKLDMPFITVKIHVDASSKMAPVHDLIEMLRNNNLLKIAYACEATTPESELLQHAQAVLRKLPPPNSDPNIELLDRETVKDRLLVIDMDVPSKNRDAELELFIRKHPDYIIALDWSNSTLYGNYIHTLDWTYGVFMKLRNAYSQHKFEVDYDDLPEKLQSEVRKVYPLRITQENKDAKESK